MKLDMVGPFMGQRNVHPSKPVWWERKFVLTENSSLDIDGNLSQDWGGYWTATPRYAIPAEAPEEPAPRTTRNHWTRPVWA